MLTLKHVLRRIGCRQADLAGHLGLSQAAVAQIVNHGAWPKRIDTRELQARIRDFLRSHVGVRDSELAGLFETSERTAASQAAARAVIAESPAPIPQEEFMLLHKQTLQTATRKHFGLFRDPLHESPQSQDDLFVNADIRYVREAMFHTAMHGGLLAVVAESGAGKTTLLRDLEDRLARERQPVMMIRPYVLAMEDGGRRGKALTTDHIVDAIMAAIAPLERPRRSAEARFAQLHRALKASRAAGFRHCLVIDEAHALPVPTLKHLKRFFELEGGFTRLLSIVLIGQPELKLKLSVHHHAVREVVQRCELVELAPLTGAALNEYLSFRFTRTGKKLGDVIDASGIDALRERLTFARARRERTETVSMLYPLAIGNLLIASMNLAAELGAPHVTADVVRSV